MRAFTVSVPVYITVTTRARTPEIAAEAGADYVKQFIEQEPMKVGWLQNGLTIETSQIEGLTEDDTPDVFETINGEEVQVYPDLDVTQLAA